MDATTVAVDVAKTVFEVAIPNRQCHIVVRRRLNRRQFANLLATASPTRVVREACGTAHYWAQCAQRNGHTVILLPPAHVRATCDGISPSVSCSVRQDWDRFPEADPARIQLNRRDGFSTENLAPGTGGLRTRDCDAGRRASALYR